MNMICNAYRVAGGGALTVTLVTPDPATPDHVRLLARLADAAETYQHDVAEALHPVGGDEVVTE